MQDTYTPPILTVDSVVFQIHQGALQVLLIRRKRDPFAGAWALPGGYNPEGETTAQAMGRILEAKAGLPAGQLAYVEQLYTFDTTARDPRGHSVSVTYLGLGYDIVPVLSSTTESPDWHSAHTTEVAYDHAEIIAYARKRLQSKIMYTNVIVTMLPRVFTLSDVQMAYQAILDKELDKRNFRKWLLAQGIVSATTEYRKSGAHRPALLYTAASRTVQEFSATI